MMKVNEVDKWREMGNRTSVVLGPVGVRLLLDNEKYPEDAQSLTQHRYCRALMKARRGEHVLLDGEGIACPAAANAFGFDAVAQGGGLSESRRLTHGVASLWGRVMSGDHEPELRPKGAALVVQPSRGLMIFLDKMYGMLVNLATGQQLNSCERYIL